MACERPPMACRSGPAWPGGCCARSSCALLPQAQGPSRPHPLRGADSAAHRRGRHGRDRTGDRRAGVDHRGPPVRARPGRPFPEGFQVSSTWGAGTREALLGRADPPRSGRAAGDRASRRAGARRSVRSSC